MKQAMARVDGVVTQESPPARGRGLKRLERNTANPYLGSPPARGRGLKLDLRGVAHGVDSGRPPHGGAD